MRVLTALALSDDSRTTAGVLLLTILSSNRAASSCSASFVGADPRRSSRSRSHVPATAHAGVLATLALVGQILADAAQLTGALAFLVRNGIWAAAILMPAGFFLSSSGRNATAPNPLIVLLYAGAASVALGVASLGVGLLSAG